jgi:GWxTD domain-containing protein
MTSKLFRPVLCLVTLLAVLNPLPALARERFPVRAVGKPFFIADAIAIPHGSDSVRVELMWEVPYRELSFRKRDRYYRARYDVTAVFLEKGRQITGDVWERRVRAGKISETRDYDKRSKGRKNILLPRGKYDVRVTVTDRTSHGTSEATAELEATFAVARIGLSDLRFVRYTGEGAVPNPSHEVPVGEEGHVVRLTLHPESGASGGYRVQWRFENAQKERIVERDTTVVVENEPVLLEIPVPSAKFSPGLQRLNVRLEAVDRGQKQSRKADLYARLTPEWFLIHRQEALGIFKIIGTAEEFEELKNTPAEEWDREVEAFWKRRDPSPGSPVNEYRSSIQSRIETAATSFQEPFRNGWKTDRGQILLQFGSPDRRTVTEGSFDGPASELWEYDSPPRAFFFVDVRGTGEFWLRG